MGATKPLTQTAKSYLNEIWLQNNYGYKEPVATKELQKGNLCEPESRSLIESVLKGPTRIEHRKVLNSKGVDRLENDFITGTPDHVLPDMVEDVKNCWSLRTFFNIDLDKEKKNLDYYYQGVGYCWLTGRKKHRVCYTLNPTPEYLLEGEIRKKSYAFEHGYDSIDFNEIEAQMIHNNELIKNMPLTDRIKYFEFDVTEEIIEKVKEKIILSRDYYKNIKL